jgi:hypothetical protein
VRLARPRVSRAAIAAALALVLAAALAGCGGQARAGKRAGVDAGANYRCVTTHPNAIAPPGEGRDASDFGSGGLWTLLPVTGALVVTDAHSPPPGTVFGALHPDGSMATKFPWWGARGAGRRLLITGARLDAHAEPLRASVAPGASHAPRFWASTITFPSGGCWRVSASAGRAQLAFVVGVRRV